MNPAIRTVHTVRLATAAALALLLVAPAHSQPSKQVTIEGVGAMDLTQVTASIEAVDVKNRIVILKGPRGNMFAVAVSDRVKNLPQVKVGDMLQMDYYESVAIEAKKVEGVPTRTDTVLAVKAAPGDKPGALALRRVNLVTNVVGINKEDQSVMVRGPLGHLTAVKIRDPQVLASLQAGGQIDMSYVEGMAVAVKTGVSKK